MRIGAHESVSGGYYKALEYGKMDGCECVQIFTHSPRSFHYTMPSEEEANRFKETAKRLNMGPNVSHATYLLNIANQDAMKRKRAIDLLIAELEMVNALGLYGLVLHPGSNPTKYGVEFAAESINKAMEMVDSAKIFIETMAGQGNTLGKSFEEIKAIIDNVIYKDRIGVCFDTCHVFAAGYDIVNEQKKVFKEFDKIVGLNKLKCFHLNDSQYELGSRKDRHENIGKGKIGLEPFRELVNDKRFKDTPAYLETPSSYYNNIRILKSLISTKA